MLADFDESDSVEARTIAGVVLAGWSIVELAMPAGSTANRYLLEEPSGRAQGYFNTRYTAALAAAEIMDWEQR